MYLRVNTVRQNGKTYRYAQLVESVRRKSDGTVMKRVVAGLGQLGEDEVANLRAALAASRQGKRVTVAQVTEPPPRPSASLRYLDVAVAWELWRRLGLDRILDELMPRGEATVAPADVVAALTIHRLVDPGSKLHARRWFRRTALPELLAVPEQAFHNARIHRVLDRLDEVSKELMRRLAQSYAQQGAFSALFLDISDATFSGEGPNLARHGRTKRDTIEKRIGILLLCNETGFPVQWKVLPGNAAEAPEMLEMLKAVGRKSWASAVPTVIDRAMGRTAYVRELLNTGVTFITAMVRSEIPAYVAEVPSLEAAFDEVKDRTEAQGVRALSDALIKADSAFIRVADDLFVKDLGVITKDEQADEAHWLLDATEEPNAQTLKIAREIKQDVEVGAAPSQAAAGRARGMKKGLVRKYGTLTRLCEVVQACITKGESRGIPLSHLIELVKLDPDEQIQRFRQLQVRATEGSFQSNARRGLPSINLQQGAQPIRLRGVLYFNPELCLHRRQRAQRKISRLEAAVDDLNSALARPTSRRTLAAVTAAVDRELRKRSLLDVFDVEITRRDFDGQERFQVNLSLREEQWRRRRRLDGFSLLVAPPTSDSLPDASGMCSFYRAKDTVEKDFQVIKSVVQLQPVWHRNDGKVNAHVTLCMLALLLERTLRKELAKPTAQALELLSDGRLNRYDTANGASTYLTTKPDDETAEILRALDLHHLTDDLLMMDSLQPR